MSTLSVGMVSSGIWGNRTEAEDDLNRLFCWGFFPFTCTEKWEISPCLQRNVFWSFLKYILGYLANIISLGVEVIAVY